MLEERKAKKAAEAREEALAEWQQKVDLLTQLVDTARTFHGTGADGLMLAKGEAVFYTVNGCGLIEERSSGGHYAGRSHGVSVPIAKVGGRSVRYRVGASKGHYVQGAPTPTAIDTGKCYITNQRVTFQGPRQSREVKFAKLIGYEHADDNSETTFSVSNRQKPTVIHYGKDIGPAFVFRLELALADYRGTTDELVAQFLDELNKLKSQRPPEPESPPLPSPPAPAALETNLAPAVPQAPATPPQPSPIPLPTPSPPTPAPPPAAELPRPAWYPDPWGAAPLRWWDGAQWTGYTSDNP